MDLPAVVLLLLRIFVGLIFIFHGVSKAANLSDFSNLIELISIPLPSVVAAIVAYFEIIGGALLVLGLWTKVIGSIFALEIIVVLLVGLFSTALVFPTISVEYNSLLLLLSLYLAASANNSYCVCCLWKSGKEIPLA